MSKKKRFLTWLSILATLFLLVSVCMFYLNKLDESQAKVTVYAAFSEVYDEFINSEAADITKVFKAYNNEKYSHTGNFILNETSLLDSQVINLLKDIPVDYSVICEPDNRVVVADVALSGYDDKDDKINVHAYISDEEILFKLDEFYNEYFMIPNNNIRENYEESLWYSLLGDILSMVPDNSSIDLYPESSMKKPVFSEFIKGYAADGTLDELFDDISIKKVDLQRDFLVGDTYTAANAYNITISKSLADKLLDIIADYLGVMKEKLIKPDKFSFTAYISDANRLCALSINIPDIMVNEQEYETAELLVSFRDSDTLFAKMLYELSVTTPENVNYIFKMIVNNTELADGAKTTVIVSMNEPELSRLFEMELTRNKASSEIKLDMAVDLSEFSGRISYACKPYEENIVIPENVLELYELNLWQILNIYSSANWSFIK